MAIYLVDQAFWKRLIGEPGQQLHPSIEVRPLIFTSHFLVIFFDNLHEGTHDTRERHNTNKHEKNTNDHFVDGDREVVSIADG